MATTAAATAPEEPVVRVRTAMEVTRRAEPKLIEPARFASELTPLGIASNLIGNAFGGDLANVRLAMREDDLAKLAAKPGTRYEIVAKTALRSDRVDLEVIAYQGTQIVSRDRVRIEPRLAREVVTTACDVRRGESIDATNSTIETRFIAPSECERAAEPATTIGTRTAKQLSAGVVVAADDIERPLAVRRNERIMVRREVGMVAIEFEAVALEDGLAGDVIAVEQAAKGRRRDAQALSAEVIAPGRAVVR
jgi:flagella basal body P-ring formation protein FlgA